MTMYKCVDCKSVFIDTEIKQGGAHLKPLDGGTELVICGDCTEAE